MTLLLGAGCLGGTLHLKPAANAGTKMLATAGTPRPWTFFSVSRQVSWLAGRRLALCLPNAQRASVTSDRAKLAAYSCGGSAGISREMRDPPASLLATKPCDRVDRDAYIWCYSRGSVNGRLQPYSKKCDGLVARMKPTGRAFARPVGFIRATSFVNRDPVDGSAVLPVSGPVVVLRARSARS
jgi:hypothetical protein